MILTEDQIETLAGFYAARDGSERTHDASCRTWRGENWSGSCTCHLSKCSDAHNGE